MDTFEVTMEKDQMFAGNTVITDEAWEQLCEDFEEKSENDDLIGTIGNQNMYGTDFSELNLDDISHKVTSVENRDGELRIQIQPLDTERGQELLDLVKDLNVSSNAVFKCELEGNKITDAELLREDVIFEERWDDE